MYLETHKLKDFRNIRELFFEPARGVNVVSGKNGEGKTNLLESIFLLSGTRSFRLGKDRDLIRFGEEFSVSESRFFRSGRTQTMRLTVSDKGRLASLNKAEPKRASSCCGSFCCTVFSPEHLNLIKGPPSERRRFMDTCLVQIYPRYASALRAYSRLVSQKSNLLKDCARVAAAYDMLDVFDSQLASAALEITKTRLAFFEGMADTAAKGYADISGGAERMTLGYESSLFKDGEPDAEAALFAIREARADDLKCGFCTVGPHRDDLAVTVGGEDARLYSSQGQQRTAVLALKLAEAALMKTALGEEPVLLLDDVLSELDESRQGLLLASVGEKQAIITACDAKFVTSRADASVFYIKDGGLI